ncbi:MAG: hypothetical protein HYX83_01270 [Chloroflexi bacterium]|nr:hypothetical protein [Chloroflexota bacterium]
MNVFKVLGLVLLGLLLSLAIIVFGVTFTVNSTVLNPKFVRTQIEELDILSLVQQFASEAANEPQTDGEGLSEELMVAVTDTVTQMEPILKERITAAVDSVYDYLLGRRPNPDLAQTLRNTILEKDFFVAIVDRIDLGLFFKQLLAEQVSSGEIPPELQGYLDTAVETVAAELKPWFKEQIENAADPLLDYLVGQSDSFSLVINTDELKTRLTANIREAITRSPPPELAGIPQAVWQEQVDQFLQEFSAFIPPTIEVDQSIFGADARTGIADGLREAEENLIQARQFVSTFQQAYVILIVLIVLFIAGIIFIHRRVKGATLNLGIIFIVSGVIVYAGFLVARSFATQIPLEDVPPSLQLWIASLINRLLSPLGTFGLISLILGIALLIFSFMYTRLRRQAKQPTI